MYCQLRSLRWWQVYAFRSKQYMDALPAVLLLCHITGTPSSPSTSSQLAIGPAAYGMKTYAVHCWSAASAAHTSQQAHGAQHGQGCSLQVRVMAASAVGICSTNTMSPAYRWDEDMQTRTRCQRYEVHSELTVHATGRNLFGTLQRCQHDIMVNPAKLLLPEQVQVSNQALTAFAIQDSGAVLGCGTADGCCSVMQISSALVEMAQNEKQGITAMFERETLRWGGTWLSGKAAAELSSLISSRSMAYTQHQQQLPPACPACVSAVPYCHYDHHVHTYLVLRIKSTLQWNTLS